MINENNVAILSEDRCRDIKNVSEMKNLCVELQEQIVEYMLSKYKEEILEDKKKSESPAIYIIGGQNASGKSKLITELKQQNENAVSIIIDDMKAHHPFRHFIDRNFPEQSEDLLHLSCFKVFDEILKYLVENKYDIIIERTLGSMEKTKKFLIEPSNHNYNIQIHVTATHEINSLLSALERFVYECELKDEFVRTQSTLKIEPRPITLEHHDNTYKNICDVVNNAENGFFINERNEHIYPSVFVWDRTPIKPTNIYVTGNEKFSCAKQAMYQGRENDLKRCKANDEFGFYSRVKNIKSTIEEAEPDSTLSEYKDFCNTFLEEIELRGKKYIGENIYTK